MWFRFIITPSPLSSWKKRMFLGFQKHGVSVFYSQLSLLFFLFVVEVGNLEFFWTILMFFDENLMFLKQFWSLLEHFWNMIFGIFGSQNWKNVQLQNIIKINDIWFISHQFCCDFDFLVNKFWKIVTFSTKSQFSGFRILWSSCQICVTSLMSFSQPNDRHTFSNFTKRKIALFWYDFVKERHQNSS